MNSRERSPSLSLLQLMLASRLPIFESVKRGGLT
jgi:hypothetical protein